jgi:hypothetical protein
LRYSTATDGLIACQPLRQIAANTSNNRVFPLDGAADVSRKYGVAQAASNAWV